MQVLSAANLTKTYGGKGGLASTRALNNISIDVESGEFTGVMGPSGSGKTTLLNILGGIGRPSTGTVSISGRNITAMDKNELTIYRRKNIGYIFQESNLLDSLTLKENIMLPLILDGKQPDFMEAKVREILSLMELSEIAEKYPYNVSGGQRQKAAVARSLINDPAVLLADEPTGNLDSKSSKAVMGCFEKINRERGASILMVTHDPFAASFCSRIVFIKDGMVHMEIVKKAGRQEFFDSILDCLAVLEGER